VAKEAAPAAPAKKKLSWKEASEWEGMEDVVLKAEEVLQSKREQLEKPEVMSDSALLTAAVHQMDEAQAEVDRLYARWAELEQKQAG
jgi:ATP-binding cassette subfamily F protein uup